jgi:hypothetical protein
MNQVDICTTYNENTYLMHKFIVITGLLFDVDSGLANFNKIVSGSGSIPGESSTYDAITRSTAFNVIDSIEKKQANPFTASKGGKYPFCFVSAAEAGWPDVPFGKTIDEKLAPAWLNKYLVAKRAVEAKLQTTKNIRSAIYRPSLIWDWTKFDVLPGKSALVLFCHML